jgi:tRNA(Ile)-lysidine synthase
MTALNRRVLDTIRQARMMQPGDRVAVAVSGGADSVALLKLLTGLRQVIGITLLVVHFDHLLRGAESESDAQFVAELAHASGLEFILEREDVASVAARNRWNLEDAARRLRYAFFSRITEEGRATQVAVAHTADDQAETILARLFRGTGPTGLAGIYPTVNSIVRPLIATRRRDLRRYLREVGQDWREDATNRDLSRQRAHIRERLLPIIERDFSARIAERLSELANLSREEEEFWALVIENRYRAIVHEKGKMLAIRTRDLLLPLCSSACACDGWIQPDGRQVEIPAGAARSVTKRLIRRLYQGLRGDCCELAAAHVEQIIHLASQSASGRRVELPGGITVDRLFDELQFWKLERGEFASEIETTKHSYPYKYVLQLPEHGTSTICVPELRSRIHLKVIDWSARERDTRWEALDGDRLRSSLVLRTWKPGDAYRPVGHRHSQKLKRLFLTRRVPREERSRWPVIECGGKVVWARGMPPAADFCAHEETRIGVFIEEDRL